MLYTAVVFFILALVAALFGFGGIATVSMGMAQLLFYIFIGLFFVSLLFSLMGKDSKNIDRHI